MTLEKIDALKGIRYNDNIFIAAGVANTNENELPQLYLWTGRTRHVVTWPCCRGIFCYDHYISWPNCWESGSLQINQQDGKQSQSLITNTNIDSNDLTSKTITDGSVFHALNCTCKTPSNRLSIFNLLPHRKYGEILERNRIHISLWSTNRTLSTDWMQRNR